MFLSTSLDLMNDEVEKVIVQPRETVVPLLGGMKFVTGVRHHEPEALLDHEPILGYRHQIEGMDAHEVGHHHHIGAAHVLLRGETLVQPPMKEDDHQEDFRLGEMKGSAHHPQNGARNLPTVMADHGTHPVLATAQGAYAIQLLSAKISDPQDGTAIEKHVVVSHTARSRSPIRSPVPFQRSSKPSERSPYGDQIHDTEPSYPHRLDNEERVSVGNHSPFSIPEKAHLELQTSGTKVGGNIPTQPKNHGASPVTLPPPGSYQGPRPPSNQHRGPPHVSLLSAPTRPRRGPGPREAWMGSPAIRRGPTAPSQVPPAGPRASFSSPVPGGSYRHPTSRQLSTPSVTQPLSQRGINHLAGLCTIIPEGRSLPSLLDPAVEKRLAQLDVDKEKLLEQIAETQRSKRAELRDWDRLDRESSICALKSELAEGHLQRMADESIGGGNLF
ncbi:uncharacterized protein PGRI_078820 [Penicillium griseofulvum]|uniref:Uncharacterized protein n=1 Tax=Penicillium patulum TaxID=5078 RepID=A0A135LUJ9_PENPA|nr:uncharacterized protein PGRI_078820 [Penicillium griseofulvum]KXG52626.1 hypothetical protein PGRI_078820 [Penicillium griseofulvum]